MTAEHDDTTHNDVSRGEHEVAPTADGLGDDGSPSPDQGEAYGPSHLDVEVKRALEAVIMVADEPADPQLLAQLVEVSPDRVDSLCAELAGEYAEEGRGFTLARVAGGWRFQTEESEAPYVERYVLAGQSARMSAAALETLAIVAYKQPISRAQVASIRGVNVEGVMRTLQQRGYIAEVSRDPGPGQASMFGTTRAFLERLGLNSLADLPALGDFVPGVEVVEALEQGLRLEASAVPETPEPATPEPATPEPATPEPATPEPATPGSVDGG